MKIYTFENREDWLESRKTRITGSRLKDIIVKRGTKKKLGFYELIAERISIPGLEENPMERGNRLEQEAIDRFEKESGSKVDSSLVLWTRDDNEAIAISPDGSIGEDEAVEVKCLSSARHLQAFFEGVPSDLKDQIHQYFIVNEKLETLHSVFYDPRLQYKDYFVIVTKREDVQEQIDEYLEYQRAILEEVNSIVNNFSF